MSFPALSGTPEKVNTPGVKTVEEVAKFLKVSPLSIIKTLILRTEKGPVVVLLRGDHELNEVKVKNFLNIAEIEMADATLIEKVTGGPVGFSGPIGLQDVPVLADHAILTIQSAVVGANEADTHLINVDPRNHFRVDNFGDFRAAAEGDLCPRCSGKLRFNKGIEVGHIFKLGVKYSKAMNAFIPGPGRQRNLHDNGMLWYRRQQGPCRCD